MIEKFQADGNLLDRLNGLSVIGKAGLMLVLFLVCLGFGYLFFFKDQTEFLEVLEAREVELKKQFEHQQKETASLSAYQEQLEQMKILLQSLLLPLPSKAEVPNLLEDISKTGLGLGLQFDLFDPLTEVNKDFYQELPISMIVEGSSYAQFALFVSQIVALNRIITAHDLEIMPVPLPPGVDNVPRSERKLQMKILAKTYRYLEPNHAK